MGERAANLNKRHARQRNAAPRTDALANGPYGPRTRRGSRASSLLQKASRCRALGEPCPPGVGQCLASAMHTLVGASLLAISSPWRKAETVGRIQARSEQSAGGRATGKPVHCFANAPYGSRRPRRFASKLAPTKSRHRGASCRSQLAGDQLTVGKGRNRWADSGAQRTIRRGPRHGETGALLRECTLWFPLSRPLREQARSYEKPTPWCFL